MRCIKCMMYHMSRYAHVSRFWYQLKYELKCCFNLVNWKSHEFKWSSSILQQVRGFPQPGDYTERIGSEAFKKICC